MKRIAFVISLLSVSCTTALAQQDYFVFIQSDKQQPFYVRLHEKTYSSSAIGHLVLSQLGDSTYHLVIGFPRNQFPEREFVIPIRGKDRGYQLKWTDDQAWVLLNEQTAEIQKPLQDATGGNNLQLGERKTGSFATLMSSLVNDSSVMYKTLVKADPPKPAAQPVVKTDTALVLQEAHKTDSAAIVGAMVAIDSVQKPGEQVVAKTDSVQVDTSTVVALIPAPDTAAVVAVVKTDSAIHKPMPDTVAVAKVTQPALAKAVINQVQERVGEHGKEWIYIDSTAGGVVDTIPVLIAFEKEPAKQVEKTVITDSAVAQKADSLSKSLVKVDSAATVPAIAAQPAIDSSKAAVIKKAPDSVVVKIDSPATAPVNKALVLFNSDCVNFANEQDVDKLRVKMLAVNSTDDKIGVAKKVFKAKCFVTRYIRGLSELFPNDEARFKFFETAYPFVSDTSSFKSLIDLLSSDLYVARFKSMVRM